MKVAKHLPPGQELVLGEMRKVPGEQFEHRDHRLVNLGHQHGYKPAAIAWSQWALAKKGYIAKVRRGRKVLYYLPQERDTQAIASTSVKYTVTYSRDEDGYIVASVPALPGCHSQGRTKNEAQRNIREAMRGYLASLKHRGEAIPEEEVDSVEVSV